MAEQRVSKVVAAILLLQVTGVSLYDLDIKVLQDSRHVIWECVSDLPLDECHVAWMDFNHLSDSINVVHLRDGETVARDIPGVSSVRYFGRGLEFGDCGVRLEVEGFVNLVVGCRVKAQGSGWKYAWSDYVGGELPRIPDGVHVEPKMAVVLPGEEANVKCKVHETLKKCAIIRSQMKYFFVYETFTNTDHAERYSYHGAGLDEGECGMRLSDTWEEDIGLYQCMVETIMEPTTFGWRKFALVVAVPPISVTLKTTTIDGTLRASCSVKGGRPSANIAWRLDEHLLREDDSNDVWPSSWEWPWMGGDTAQKFQWIVAPEEHGAMLSCVVTHPALNEPVLLQYNLVYSNPPEDIFFDKTIIIDEHFPTEETTVSTKGTTESTEGTTETTRTMPSTSSSTTSTTTSTTSSSTTSTTTSTTSTSTTTSTTTEGPNTECCCHVKRCHSVFRENIVKRTCTNTFTCDKIKICCPQL